MNGSNRNSLLDHLLRAALVLCCCGLGLAACAAAPAPAADDWISQLEGGWIGEDNVTPMGRMPFALLFEREDDGSLYSRSALNRETWIDLRFHRDGGGRWLLNQGASMEGLGQQQSTLVPVEADGEIRRWVDPRDPEFLAVELAVDDAELFMRVLLRGELHAQFDLARMPEDELPALRRSFTEGAERAPAAASIHDHTNDESVPQALREARRAVAASPDDARLRMRLAGELGRIIQADPQAMGARYAAEMLRALLDAVELDPELPEAYQGLAGYYMQAPPIAGGSLELAEQMARRLRELDPAAGDALLASLARRRDAPQP